MFLDTTPALRGILEADCAGLRRSSGGCPLLPELSCGLGLSREWAGGVGLVSLLSPAKLQSAELGQDMVPTCHNLTSLSSSSPAIRNKLALSAYSVYADNFVSSYSVYADNCLSAYTLFADKNSDLNFSSAYCVQKYYILNL